MKQSRKIILGAIAAVAVFALLTPYVMAEVDEKRHHHMAEKMNAYCEMSEEEKAEAISKWHKSQEMVDKLNEYCALDEEGRAEMVAQYKEKFKDMKAAFSAISQEDQDTIKNYMKEMKSSYEEMSEEEKTAKRAEFKEHMKEFMELSLDEKITHLQEFAESIREN